MTIMWRCTIFFYFSSITVCTLATRFIDIYTNHNDVQEVLRNYGAATRRPNQRFIANNRRNYDGIIADGSAKRNFQDDKLESEFGEIVQEHPAGDQVTFTYQTRRPRFKTQKYNWTKGNKDQLTRFSYVQKIPKFHSDFEERPPINDTKERINEMLKTFLTKFYTAKYNTTKFPKPPGINPKDDDPKTKYFDQSIWSFKNKTKTIVNKLFSLFTVIQFPNSKCSTNSSSGTYEGICYTSTECTNLNGTAMGNCANGYGVCCVFKGTCGGSARQNCSYFESPNYPNYYPSDNTVTVAPPVTTLNPSPTPDPRLKYHAFPMMEFWGRQTTATTTCTFNINKINSNITQMRIDFLDLELLGPTNGTCTAERLIITGQNANDQIPALCGFNTGQHVYVDVSMVTGPITLSVLSTVTANKRFKIRICQFAMPTCTTNNCLQYYTGVTGTITSFNYDQAAMFNRSVPGYYNNLNYAICIRKEAGFCSVTFTNVRRGVEYPFQFRNINDNGQTTVPLGQAGADVFNCPDDYIVIDGTRLCGDKFNDGTVVEDFTMNAPVTDSSAGPIVIPVRTDQRVTGIGFKLFYTQNRCTTN